MRKYLFVLAFLLSSAMSFAQTEVPEKKGLRWNAPLGISLGYSHVYNKPKGDEFVNAMPTDLFDVDVNAYGIYMGLSFMQKETGYKVYGFNEMVTTFAYRTGISVRAHVGKGGWLVITPYIGWLNISVKDTSHNSIGARTNYGNHDISTYGGCKLAYRQNNWDVSLHASTRDFGVGVGLYIDPFHISK